MCGLAGILNTNGKPVNLKTLVNMTNAHIHRGPDDQGFALFSTTEKHIKRIRPHELPEKNFNAGIGFNRLSILDLSHKGRQPMVDSIGKIMLAYNGETYNAFHEKEDLVTKGYTISSKTDTEVVLNLYKEYGIYGMLERMNGMFAFYLVDLINNVSYLVRDHFGIKPMYFYQAKGTILFSSEIKSFLSHPEFEAQIDSSRIDEYILFRYNAFNRSLFKGVEQIPPGHFLKISGEKTSLVQYWSPSPSLNERASLNSTLEKLDTTLKASIEGQLISDVKVGCQLSGGIDSSLVTHYSRNHFKAKMDTFSIVFDNPNYSEEPWIDQITKLTSSESFKYKFNSNYAVQNITDSTWHLDIPLNLPNTLAIKLLAQESSKEITVLMSGEGADELFGGYNRYYDLAFRQRHGGLIKMMRNFPYLGKKFENKYNPALPPDEFFILNSVAVKSSEYYDLGGLKDIQNLVEERKNQYPTEFDPIKNASIYDMKTYMVDLLNRQDKMTMAHSVENRVPFLDRNVVDFILSTPSKFLVSTPGNISKFNKPGGHTKLILKKIAERKFGSKFVYRTKSGFPLPILDVFMESKMNQLINDSILPGIHNRGVFNIDFITKKWLDIERYPDNRSLKLLWMAFTFEIWAQVFIDRSFSND